VSPPILQQTGRTEVIYRGRKLTYFGGCDYFRLASDPRVLAALESGLRKYGLNVAASRQTTGDHRIYHLLEERLEQFFNVQKAVLLPTGYVANLAAAEVLARSRRFLYIDEKAHRSLCSAAIGAGLRQRVFRHRDANHLSAVMAKGGENCLVFTDGLFGHDGSIAPLPAYLEALPDRAFVMVDDAHGAGVLGARGQGTPEFYGLRDPRIIQTITLSKAFGVFGGAVLGAREAVGEVRKSSYFSTSTPLPLPLAAAVLTALQLLRPASSLRHNLAANVSFVKKALNKESFSIPDDRLEPAVPPNLGELSGPLTW